MKEKSTRVVQMIGLTPRDCKTLEAILGRFPSVRTVYIFGSRAKGSFNSGSDIDLAIMNDGVSDKEILRLKSEIEESTLPYFVDIVNYPTLRHKELKEHIDRVGQPFYEMITGIAAEPIPKYEI